MNIVLLDFIHVLWAFILSAFYSFDWVISNYLFSSLTDAVFYLIESPIETLYCLLAQSLYSSVLKRLFGDFSCFLFVELLIFVFS